MAQQIIIGGKNLDLSEKTIVNLNMSINDISDISTRNSSYSNSFSIPKTSNNQDIFEMLGMIGTTTRLPYQKVRCKYFLDGVAVISDGYLQITDTTDEYYKVVMYDGIIDLDAILGDSTIADLDYSENNHYLNVLSDVTDTFTNTWSDGYIYALGQFGKPWTATNPNPCPAEGLAPSVYAKYVFNKIFSSRGLSTTGFFDEANTDWEQLVLPPTKGIDISEVTLNKTNNGTASSDALNVSVLESPLSQTLTPMVFSTDSWTNFTLSSGSLVVASYTGLMEFNFTSTYTKSASYPPTMYIRMFVNEVFKRSIVIEGTSPVTHAGQVLEVTSGDVIRMEIASYGKFNTTTYTFEPYSYTHTASLQVNTLSGGTLIEVENYMTSTLKQKDFLKEVMQRFGVVIVKNPSDGDSYNFVSMDSILSDKANAIDWTDKLVSIKRESYTPDFAQSNDADYKYSEENVVPFMNGSMLVDNENLEVSKTLFTSKFEIPTTYPDVIDIYPLYDVPIWEYNTDTLAYDNIEDKVRLMRLTQVTLAGVIYFNIYGSGAVSEQDIALLGLTDMDYQYFFDTYYPNFKIMLDDFKKIEVDVILNSIDYNNLDFGKLIFLKQTGKYYYLNSIKSKGVGLGKAELIAINN